MLREEHAELGRLIDQRKRRKKAGEPYGHLIKWRIENMNEQLSLEALIKRGGE